MNDSLRNASETSYRVDFKLRTPEKLDDFDDLRSRIPSRSPKGGKTNGKARGMDAFLNTLSCEVPGSNLVNVYFEFLAYVENRPLDSYEISVQMVG